MHVNLLSVAMQGLAWVPRIVVACTQQATAAGQTATAAGAQLRLYPRSHIDEASCLAHYQLPTVMLSLLSLHSSSAPDTLSLRVT